MMDKGREGGKRNRVRRERKEGREGGREQSLLSHFCLK